MEFGLRGLDDANISKKRKGFKNLKLLLELYKISPENAPAYLAQNEEQL